MADRMAESVLKFTSEQRHTALLPKSVPAPGGQRFGRVVLTSTAIVAFSLYRR